MQPLRVACAVLLVVLLLGIGWAALQGPVWVALAAMLEEPWQLVTLADLGAGLLLTGAWIVWREGWKGIPWLILLGGLGNVATLTYVLVRGARCRSVAELLLPAAGRARSEATRESA